jgi:hypothetical protein
LGGAVPGAATGQDPVDWDREADVVVIGAGARAAGGEKAPDWLVGRENALPAPLRNFVGGGPLKGRAITAPEGKPSPHILRPGQPHDQSCRDRTRSSRLGLFDNISLDRLSRSNRLKGVRYLCPRGAAASARGGREVDLNAEITIRPFVDFDSPRSGKAIALSRGRRGRAGRSMDKITAANGERSRSAVTRA